jgi:hypothetical protein
MYRAIALLLIFMASTANAGIYGERQPSEYPGDTAPSDVWFIGPILVEPVYIPAAIGTGLNFYEPGYYWWEGLEGAGLQVGADGTKMFARMVRGYNGDKGKIKLTFDTAPENLRVRLIGFPKLKESVKVNGEKIDKDDFTRESTACEYYWNPHPSQKLPCTIYQAIVPSDGELIQIIKSDEANILKITSVPGATVPPPPPPPEPPGECSP